MKALLDGLYQLAITGGGMTLAMITSTKLQDVTSEQWIGIGITAMLAAIKTMHSYSHDPNKTSQEKCQ